MKVYRCDPEKHKDCPKDTCQKECFYTSNKEFALDNKVYIMDVKAGTIREAHLKEEKEVISL